MATAEIITIGTELLLGEIPDTNSQYLAKALNDEGFDVFRVTTVGDNVTRISQVIREALRRSDLIITTGGLGPTIDDPTRDAVALAFDVSTVYHEELWEQIEARFRSFNRLPTENNQRQAYIPANATAIENKVGTAPAFYIVHQDIFLCSLPGVPSEMQFLFVNHIKPLIRKYLPTNSVLLTTIIHTIGIGESHIDQLIGNFERLQNPTVGLAAHMGSVDIRISAKACDKQTAQEMIQPVLKNIQALLGKYIYGYDQQNLFAVLRDLLVSQDSNIVFKISPKLNKLDNILTQLQTEVAENLVKNQYNNTNRKYIKMDITFHDIDEKTRLTVSLDGGPKNNVEDFTFSNDISVFDEWVFNQTMGSLYKLLK
ncbi:MAG: CinA family nicotinamide mononucleotide deamidase-related protein [Chloroflexi bacterium]|nr:CinA family nicotinamide mononucleotide deamidase-related protein [Chloroflexota bacterium]